ncbi:hydrolase, NUDIX family protein [Ascosphaera apis ARSEF 7405]|uniref:Hydrolase, NUDIX family protein n=1 Tax=Ascosphaera apis ARSEF 7405 TaxID=392613 RepID=A0A167X0A8_9EURO|nr:hydrolase, NUDIX family protein [Ascosphaera apis ARSEF 7405]
MLSNLDLIKACDRAPYPQHGLKEYESFFARYHAFRIQGCDRPLGYIMNEVVRTFPWPKEHWRINPELRTVTLLTSPNATVEHRSEIIKKTLLAAKALNQFPELKGWRNELFAIYGPNRVLLANIERAAVGLFGIMSYGVHVTAYVEDEKGLRIWVPRRAKTKQTWPGMLDNSIAGGLASGEKPFECMLREASEEASIPEHIVRSRAKACGMVSYIYIGDGSDKGSVGTLQPDNEYVYDLRLDADTILRPCDKEVEEFKLCSVEEVQAAMARGEFKPNCPVVLIDFFIRHGIITPENEKDYMEIVLRSHRHQILPIV